MADMAVVKNHNPFAVNDAIFAKVLDYDWHEDEQDRAARWSGATRRARR